MELLERDAALKVLADGLRNVANGTGQIVLIAGEAGIGKTSLLHAAAESRGDVDLWWGACDALETPHPLAPLHDIARSSAIPFRSLLGAGLDRAALFEAVLTALGQSSRATLVVIEDAHWADDATLDLLAFLGRRIAHVPCLLVISYRDDELSTSHPLRRLFGGLPASSIARVNVPRLSAAAVERLALRALRSPTGVYEATRGNPFFVTELLRHGTAGVPRSVQDLVIARFARLSIGARAIVELASVVPARIETSLVEELLPAQFLLIEECLNSGLLTAAGSVLSFRHELARVAIETSLSDPAARTLHAGVLAVLLRAERTPVSLARIVHHATRAGDSAAVLEYAPQAANQAQQRGAHREAAAHYRTAIEHAGGIGRTERAGWLEAYARECQQTDQLNEAITARLRLGELHHDAASTVSEAENLSQLALVYVLALQNSEADAASSRAIELLEALSPGVQLAGAYRVEAHLRMLNRDCEASVAWSTKALALAKRFEHREILVSALSTLGTATMFSNFDAGCAHLQRALDLALTNGLHAGAAMIYSNLGSASGELFRLPEALHYLTTAVAFAQRHEVDFYRNYAMSWLALCELYLGHWDTAERYALEIIGQTTHRTTSRVMALVALGRLQARRGDSAAAETLDEALDLALLSNTLQRLAPVRAARAEAAYLRGDFRAVVEEAEPMVTLATRHQHAWFIGEFTYWMQRAGRHDVTATLCVQPYTLQLANYAPEAAAAWAKLGCPYEQARALAEGAEEHQLEALALFEQLGARPAADDVRRRLRAAGRRGVPRGARTITQANAHGLTTCELEVLALVCQGLKNSEVADRLCRSVRTIDHHLAAAFQKLGVSSRTQARAVALRAGIGP